MIGDFAQQIDRYVQMQSDSVCLLLGMRLRVGEPFVRETKICSEISTTNLRKFKALIQITKNCFSSVNFRTLLQK